MGGRKEKLRIMLNSSQFKLNLPVGALEEVIRSDQVTVGFKNPVTWYTQV